MKQGRYGNYERITTRIFSPLGENRRCDIYDKIFV
jgi:hypothetical protein